MYTCFLVRFWIQRPWNTSSRVPSAILVPDTEHPLPAALADAARNDRRIVPAAACFSPWTRAVRGDVAPNGAFRRCSQAAHLLPCITVSSGKRHIRFDYWKGSARAEHAGDSDPDLDQPGATSTTSRSAGRERL